MTKDIYNPAREIEKSLGLPKNFIRELLNEDDWSFIIKIHVLLEASISFLLLKKMGNPKLAEVLNRIELSNKITGKMAFIKCFELLDKDQRRFIHKISEIRNDFVHDIKFINKNLDEYFLGLNRQRKTNIINALKFCIPNGIQIRDKKLTAKEFIQNGIKISIWVGLTAIFAFIYIEKEKIELDEKYTISAKDMINEYSAKQYYNSIKKEESK